MRDLKKRGRYSLLSTGYCCLLLVAVLMSTKTIFAQQRIALKGMVTSTEDNLPIPGVSVSVKGGTAVKLLCCLLLFSFITAGDTITVYSIGDSTMADASPADNYPGRGWMQMAGPFFNEHVKLVNCARSGRSSKSFITEGHWKKTLDKLKAGDYVFIQFGHNDQKPDTARHTEPSGEFRLNLIRYIDESRARGAYPILFTSIVRRKFGKNGKLEDTHGDYVTVVRELAKEKNVPLVDMNKATADLVEQMGVEGSKKLFLYIAPGVTSKLPEGKKDDTHLCVYGASSFAKLAAEGVKELNLPLSKYVQLSDVQP